MPSVVPKKYKTELSSVTANRAVQLNRSLVSIDVIGIEHKLARFKNRAIGKS